MTFSWNLLFMLFALGLVFYSGWSLWRDRRWQDIFYVLLGLYLVGLQLPLAVPALGLAQGATCPLGPDYTSRLLRIAPAAVLLVAANVGDS